MPFVIKKSSKECEQSGQFRNSMLANYINNIMLITLNEQELASKYLEDFCKTNNYQRASEGDDIRESFREPVIWSMLDNTK